MFCIDCIGFSECNPRIFTVANDRELNFSTEDSLKLDSSRLNNYSIFRFGDTANGLYRLAVTTKKEC